MNRPTLSFVLLFFSSFSFGQTTTHSCDSLFRKAIQKQIAFPYSNIADSSGATLIKVLKNGDSLYIDLLYTSSNQFDLNSDKGIRYRLNKYKENFPNGYLVYVPIYFDFYLEGEHKIPLDNNLKVELKRHIKMLGDKAHILTPVTIEGYQTVH